MAEAEGTKIEVQVDPIIAIHNQENGNTKVYSAVLSENSFSLRITEDSEVNSSLTASTEHAKRLKSAHIFVIVSSQSGAGLAESAYDNLLVPLFQALELEVVVHKTTSKTSHQEFLSTTRFPDGENVILILGGDTLVYDLINTLPGNPHLTAEHRFAISLVPCGTGNALSVSLGMTSIPIGISLFLGVSKSSSGHLSYTLPVNKIIIREGDRERSLWSAVVCSWGLHASLVADSDDPEMRREYGAKRFGVAAQRLLSGTPHVYRGRITSASFSNIDDSPLQLGREHTYILFTRVSNLEPTFPIAPDQSPKDIGFTIVLAGPMSGEELMGVMMAVYDNSKHIGMEAVEYRWMMSAAQFTIDEPEARWRRICIDGDILTLEDGAVVTIAAHEGVWIGGHPLEIISSQ